MTIGQTTLKQTKKILGKPTKRRVPPIIQHKWEKRIELGYAESKSTLRFGYKRKILYNITLDSASTVTINNSIKLSVSDTSLILKIFGSPKEINKKPSYPYFYYKLNPYDVYFSFDDNSILYEASFFQHNDSDTSAIIPEDTTKIFFGVYVRHIEEELSNITVNLVSKYDTISVVTNKEGIADTLLPKGPYPKIIIKEKGYEDYEMQITDKFINECDFTYKRINLISLADSIYKVKPCDSENIYAIKDSLLKEKIGMFPTPDKIPNYKGGLITLKTYFASNPLKGKYVRVTDFNVSIAFLVTCEGKVGNYKIIESRQGVYETSANQVLAIVKKMPQFWQPATKDNKAVDCYQVLSFAVTNRGKLDKVTYNDK